MIPEDDMRRPGSGVARKDAPPATWRLAGLAAFVAASSLAPVQKYLGTTGLFLYVAGVFLAVFWGRRPAARWLEAHVSERQSLWLAACTLVLLGVLFAVVYPIANAGVVGGGSDRDDSLTLATRDLLQGRYPYYAATYLGQLPPTLPGAMILAAPFVLLGNSAYQNILWLAVFLIVARWLFRDGRQALLLVWSMLAFAPAIVLELVTGGELISNTVYVLTFILLLTRAASDSGGIRWRGLVYAALLGLALSSRSNFLLLLPLVFSALVQQAGWRTAGVYCAVAGAAFAAVTLPFYLYDPAGFAPVMLQNKFAPFRALAPFADVGVVGLAAASAIGLSFRRFSGQSFALLAACAVPQCLLILFGHLLTALQAGALKLSFGVEGWGLFFLFFGVLGLWPVDSNTPI